MAPHDRIHRQQVLREAEGYLELIHLFGDHWMPQPAVRHRLAQRVLTLLDGLPRSAFSTDAYWLKGQALRTLDRFAEAVAPLKEAAQAEPDKVSIWLALGWCYKRAGRLDMAIESLEQALATASGQAIVHYNLACYWSLAGNRRQALRYLAQAISLDESCRVMVEDESDFDPIRNDPGFQALIGVIV